ncbi:hypothetical protein [Dialister hominis]|uniref:hypothetical protein n=1 Tax=Dialister hominis TaxID=2582419 RepID=UPI003FD80538
MMEIHLDEKNLQIADKLLSGALVNVRAASSAAINRTLPHARKRLVEKAKERYVVKPGPLKGSIRLLKAGAGSMTGIVKSSGHPLPLSYFQTRFPRTKRASARVLRNGILKPVKGLFKQGHIFHRKQPARYPLTIPAGPSAPQMVGYDKGVSAILPDVEYYLNQRFLHEVTYRFKGFGG